MTVVRVIPKSKRARERVRQHGDTMLLRSREAFRGEPAALVQAISQNPRPWGGWFTTSEADVESVDE